MSVLISGLYFIVCVATAIGRPELNIESRIVGGKNATTFQFPYQVSLQIRGYHVCGGSIISDRTVLTSAYCVYGITDQIDAVVGTKSLKGGTRHLVVQAIYHEQYNWQEFLNDVAVLYVAIPFQFNSFVQPVRLATLPTPSDSELIVSGWGLTSYYGSIANNLQYLLVRSLELQACVILLVGANPITEGNVCTISPRNQGACLGDSGGPLVDTNGRQVGIVSWGIPCALGNPDVYASVAFYLDWIKENMK